VIFNVLVMRLHECSPRRTESNRHEDRDSIKYHTSYMIIQSSKFQREGGEEKEERKAERKSRAKRRAEGRAETGKLSISGERVGAPQGGGGVLSPILSCGSQIPQF
jgi:hypothetical protein